MLKSSLRQVARRPSAHSAAARPPHSSPITASFSSQSHQRRHSSSKPPVPPNDGTRNISTSSVKEVGTPRSKGPATARSPPTDQSSATDVRVPKRKIARQKANSSRDGSNQWARNMPSVPSTQHLSIDDIAISSFFSLHRPMSVTSSIPHEASSKAVDAIFAPKKPSSRQIAGSQDVIYTIASVIQSLGGNIAHQQQNSEFSKSEPQRTDVSTALTQHQNRHANQADPTQEHHLDGQPSHISIRIPKGVQLMMQEVTRHFRPYNTPPAPVPMSGSQLDAQEAEFAAAEAAEEEQAGDLERQIEEQDRDRRSPDRRGVLSLHDLRSRKFFTNKAPLLTIKDLKTHGDPRQRIRFLRTEVPSSVGRIRRDGYRARKEREIGAHGLSFYAISVKRQRRLKMKKHKYKKLMRKTRNLRRRQDKL